jgi:tetratricopeptide (TPR) repeat protein
MGAVYSALGQKEKALGLYEQALAVMREVGDRGGEGTTLNNLGLVYSALGQKGLCCTNHDEKRGIPGIFFKVGTGLGTLPKAGRAGMLGG